MKSLLKAGAAVVALAAMALVLLFAFGSLERGRAQPPALAPTPAPTPRTFTFTPTPTPNPNAIKPGQPVVDPWVVDPNWGRAPEPTFPVRPTPTPRPATGGPYISQARAVEIAVASARRAGQVDESILPRALFTTAKEIPAILGQPRQGPSSDYEYWVVWIHGRFKSPNPGGESPIVFTQARAIIDATNGQIDIWSLLDGQ